MLCASGLEFEKKLRRATVEQANAQRALNSGSHPNGSQRFEDASERYNRRLSDFMNHKRVCSLCSESQPAGK